jgi:hypothetical protein
MHTFKVVEESYGWAVRLGDGMTTPFRSRALAIREANCLCQELRNHGEAAEVVIQGTAFSDPPRIDDWSRAAFNTLRREQRRLLR